MHPQLIPGLPIQSFGLCVGLGVLLSWMLIDRLSKPKDFGNLVFLLVFAGILGARLTHVIEYWHVDRFDVNVLRAFKFWEGGLVFYGGLIAAILAFLVWWRVKRADFFATADILAVALPLGHAFGRLGCFFNGCCWGRPSHAWYAVRFPATSFCGSDPVIPTQLFESAALFMLCGVLYLVYRRYRRYTTALYLMAYGVIRFGIEFLRADDRPDIGGLSSAQTVSLMALAIGFVFWVVNVRQRGESSCDHR